MSFYTSRTLLSIAIIVPMSVSLLGSDEAFASAGCDAVNGKTFSASGGTATASILPLETGDVFSFTATELIDGGTFAVYNADGSGFDYFPPPAGTTVSGTFGPFTVQRDGSQMRYQSYEGINNSWQVTITCTSLRSDSHSALSSQQKQLSTLVVNQQSNLMADAIFNQIGQSFQKGGQTVTVSPNAFAVSSRSFDRWIKQQQKEHVAKLGYQTEKKSETASPFEMVEDNPSILESRWNVWAKGRYSHFEGTSSGFEGDVASIFGGADYKLNHSTVIGGFAGYGKANFDTRLNNSNGSFEADGFSFGSYVGLQLPNAIQLDAFTAYTYSDYENESGSTKGDFQAHRVTVGGQLSGHWTHDAFYLDPGVRILYAQENQSSSIDSNNGRHSSNIVRAGRISVGPKFGFVHSISNDASLNAWTAIRAEYDFSNQDASVKSSLPDIKDTLSARVEAGFDAKIGDSFFLSVGADASGLGSNEYIAYGSNIKLSWMF